MRKTSAAFAITFAYMLHLPLAAWAGDPLPRAKPEEVGMSTERLALIGKAVGGDGKDAAVGGILGGATAAGVVAASKGYQVVLKEGTVLRFTVNESVAMK